MKRIAFLGLVLASGLLALAACTDEVPTSTNPDLIPISVETFETILDFDAFGTGVRVDGGYGSPSTLQTRRIVLSEDESLEIRSLLRFASAPGAINVFPPGESQSRADSAATPVGGRVLITFDSLGIDGLPPFRLEAATPTRPWDFRTASWTHAVDTISGVVPWDEPGGDLEPIGVLDWNPLDIGRVTFEMDSLTAAEWADGDNLARGLMLSVGTPDSRLRIASANFELDMRSSINPDTVVTVTAPIVQSTMLISDQPDADDGRMLVGGAPAFRSTFRIELPDSVDATGAICAGAPTCRIPLTSDRIIFASLGLRSIPTEPPAMAPTDSLVLDLRPVLAPERLPRSPLGTTLLPQGRFVGPEIFLEGGETFIEIPVTSIVRRIADWVPGGDPPPSTLSLISASEPSGIGVATFGRIGTPNAPVLRLILTSSETVTIP